MRAVSLAPYIAAGLTSYSPSNVEANSPSYGSVSWRDPSPTTTSSSTAATSSLPIVDLGYGLWRATINETGGYYNFSNIRFARPPVGDLRFAKPLPPLDNRSSVNDGQDGRVCPQGTPSWNQERGDFIHSYLSDPTNISAYLNVPPPGITPGAKPPGQANGFANEDCLFLDVIVPISVYDNASKSRSSDGCGTYDGQQSSSQTASVLVRMFGGGFYLGSKNSEGNPAGLVLQSMKNPASAPGMIYVGINYRLGALGWLAGPSFYEEGGHSNVGLHDQRLALEWIQQHIHLFGGDPGRVTLSGASAGASSTMLHITAHGGKGKGAVAPFQQAFPESPALNVNPYNWEQELTYQNFLKAANVSTLAALRSLSSAEVIAANELTIWEAGYGSSGGYGPVVDGDYVPAPPTQLLAQGRFAKNVRALFTGHNTDEGLIFLPPQVQNSTALSAYLHGSLLPDAPAPVLNTVMEKLYPPETGVKTPYHYNDTISRGSTLLADYLLNCNVQALLEAFGPNVSHAYLFEEGAALHGEETNYYFYNDGPMADNYGFGLVNGTVAIAQQNWIVSFVATGNPNAPGNVAIPEYGAATNMGVMSSTALGASAPDPALKERCDFWRAALTCWTKEKSGRLGLNPLTASGNALFTPLTWSKHLVAITNTIPIVAISDVQNLQHQDGKSMTHVQGEVKTNAGQQSQATPLRPAPLFKSGSGSQRASPFQRPVSPATRSPSTVRASTPTQTSPLKSSNTPASDAQSPTRRPSARTLDENTRASPITQSNLRHRGPSSTAGTITQSSFANTKTNMPASKPGAKSNDPLSKIPPQQVHSMRESFAVLDRSNTGTIQTEDVSHMLNELGLDTSPSSLASFFPSSSGGIGSTSGGGINLATYLNGLASSLAPLSDPQELLAAFSAFDEDDSGQVAVDELREALLSTAPEAGEQRLTQRDIDSVMDGFSGRRAFSKGMIGKADVKKDEVFRYREFVTGITGGPSANTGAEVQT